jgi:hypothetical protein
MGSIRAVAVVRRQQHKHVTEQIRIAAGRARGIAATITDKVTEPGAVATGSKAQLALLLKQYLKDGQVEGWIRSLPLAVPYRRRTPRLLGVKSLARETC